MSVRNWGMAATFAYAVVVVLLLMPAIFWLADDIAPAEAFPQMLDDDLALFYIWAAVLIVGHAMLLLVTVDRTDRRLPPRRPLAYSVILATLTFGLLAAAAIASVVAAVWGDDGFDQWLWLIPAVWVISAVVCFLYRRGISERLDRILSWLIAGSILELLVAVPCHVVVRQREDCCAPGITALGIATGIAVMLMTIGPGVYFLYRRKLDQYNRPAIDH